MSPVGRNIAANIGGTAVVLTVLLVAVPVYLRLLGAEAYGLASLLTTAVIAATALDLGLGATINRELARTMARPSGQAPGGDAAATLQAACWAVAITAGIGVAVVAPTVATRWLRFFTLSAVEVRGALVLLGAIVPALIMRGFYMAALNGLQRQGVANLVQASGSLVRGIATVLGLQLVAPTPRVFFVTQLVVFYLEVAVLIAAFCAVRPPELRGGRVRLATIRPLLGFSAGIAGTMLLGLSMTSMDQMILSAILPLSELGYYTLAVTVAAVLGHLVQPITTAIYPRFSQLFERGDVRGARDHYHFFSQLVATIVMPLGAVLVFFPDDVLTLWTRDADFARSGALVLSLRTVGTVLNTLMHVPHIAQLAFGWSALGAGANAVAALLFTPLLVVLSQRWGGSGAGVAWIVLNLGMFLVAMAWMHRRVLPGELGRWYGHLVLPAIAVVVVGGLGRATMPEALGPAARLGWVATTGVLAVGAALASAALVRRRVAVVARLARAE
jgi:O-antigen/teichoic acid export membrane protein